MKKFNLIHLLLIIPLISSCISTPKEDKITKNNITAAEKLFDLSFTDTEKDSMLDGLNENLQAYKEIHKTDIDNAVPPALLFDPLPVGFEAPDIQQMIDWKIDDNVQLPANRDALAFYTVRQLSSLIKNHKITSVELTKFFLDRLKKYGDTLHCVISLTEELAMEQARRADNELARGIYRGPLHGIPYGVKDLFAVKGYKTTWGAMPYKDQVRNETATVVNKLEDAGAVLVAKLTLGALAMDDVWFGGQTRNPWDLNQGSSGSSAGSAAAVSAGLVPFALGTETWGSIVSPSTRCGVSGLRPTFGRVSRAGAMALSWSMDKVGPIARSADDCAMVFNVIRGIDGLDKTVRYFPFNYDPTANIHNLKVGYFKSLFKKDGPFYHNDSLALVAIRNMGITLHPVELPDSLPVESLAIILNAEASAAFDELTRSNRDSLLVRQGKWAWPNIFRTSRFIPATEYIQANRIRTILIRQVYDLFKQYDVIVSPSFGGDQLLLTNLTGNPCMVVPDGFDENGHPTSISFLGNLMEEAKIIEFANAFQQATDYDEQHPKGF